MDYLLVCIVTETPDFLVHFGRISALGITQRLTTSLHPNSNGQAERTNQTILQVLRALLLRSKVYKLGKAFTNGRNGY